MQQVYDNLPEAITGLKARGYTTDFSLAFEKIACNKTGKALSPAEFEIIEHYRFEGDTDPDNASVLYAISSKDGSMKGMLINAYGVYSDPITDELVNKLSVHLT